MGEISELVGKLLAQGAAYRVDDPEHPDVYFDSAVTGHFGYVSNYDESTMIALSGERGGDPDRPGKRHPVDPLLWRMARDGEPSWESDLGAGRPGWHVECAAIALNRLGTQIDLNGGGSDLIFPHHECGAAHAEAFTGVQPFARHYTHSGMIGLDGEKMSKSRGNLVFVSKLRSPAGRPERDPAGPAGRALPRRPPVDRGAADRGAGPAGPLAGGGGPGRGGTRRRPRAAAARAARRRPRHPGRAGRRRRLGGEARTRGGDREAPRWPGPPSTPCSGVGPDRAHVLPHAEAG